MNEILEKKPNPYWKLFTNLLWLIAIGTVVGSLLLMVVATAYDLISEGWSLLNNSCDLTQGPSNSCQ